MLRMLAWGGILLDLFVVAAGAAEFNLSQCRQQFLSGQYQKAIEHAEGALADGLRNEDWHWVRVSALWMTGDYPKARQAIEAGQRANYYSIRLRLLGHKIYRSAGDPESAQRMLDEINAMGGSRRFGLREPVDFVALGEAAVLLGADPKLVLENFFNPAKKSDPNLREVYLAIGQLALSKHDYALAGKAFQEGLAKHAEDPDLLHGLAEALAPSDRKEMLAVLEKVFAANEHHPEARLLLVEHLVDAEEYGEAEAELAKLEGVNPHHPHLWAFRALLAHLRNDPEAEKSAREAGLRFWDANPAVDHLIGRKLSQKYRFAEGASYQRKALEFDPSFLPAKGQLAQDLLRLGQEGEGWKLADEVFRADAYDIAAYNLVTLHDTLAKFRTITNEHFIVRMAALEADVYGSQVLALLGQARAQLTKKYGLELERPVTVEIFPEQKDFAVRTFGMPGGEGYLGVCFGNVITANSPASHNMNWHSMLWHEFCHVVTLNLTRNKMPRWLSEGISVYEERRADPRWGEQLNPQYREFIVEGEMKPIADMSAAFMAPPSGLHMQFAYYQSSLVVEFLIERFGLAKMRDILRDLGEGKPINEALTAHTAPMAELEKDFKAFARGVAETLGPDSVWKKPDRIEKGALDPMWAALHPDNFWVIREKAAELLGKEKAPEAIALLEKSIQLHPRQKGSESAYAALAAIHRTAKDLQKERDVLLRWTRLDGESLDPLLRLLEMDRQARDFHEARQRVRQCWEIHPLHPLPHLAKAEALEASGEKAEAIQAYRTLLFLDPPDRPEVHFRMAGLLRESTPAAARRHVLLALEEAPRFRAAQALLLELVK